MNYNVEDKLFRQQVYWVGGLIVDMLKLEVRLSLIADPDIQEIDGVIIFEGCKQFAGQFHDSETYNPDYIPSLLGILDTPEEAQTRYIITTDTVEISFTTSIEPRALWKDPNRPKEIWTWEETQVWEHSSADSPMPQENNENGKGDYSTERHALLDPLAQEDILAQIHEMQKGTTE